jgi:hypothetical protein
VCVSFSISDYLTLALALFRSQSLEERVGVLMDSVRADEPEETQLNKQRALVRTFSDALLALKSNRVFDVLREQVRFYPHIQERERVCVCVCVCVCAYVYLNVEFCCSVGCCPSIFCPSIIIRFTFVHTYYTRKPTLTSTHSLTHSLNSTHTHTHTYINIFIFILTRKHTLKCEYTPIRCNIFRCFAHTTGGETDSLLAAGTSLQLLPAFACHSYACALYALSARRSGDRTPHRCSGQSR